MSGVGAHATTQSNDLCIRCLLNWSKAPGITRYNAPSTMKPKLLCALLTLSLLAPIHAQTAPATKPLDLLKHRLETISQGVSADWGVYIKSLDTGEEISINADAAMDTMSAIKIP